MIGPHRGRGPQAWSRSDAALREEVCERLLHDRLLDARGIEVSVRDGVVTLTGEVPGASDAVHAAMLARECAGVLDVEDRIVLHAGPRRVDRPDVEAPPEQPTTRWGKWVPPFTP